MPTNSLAVHSSEPPLTETIDARRQILNAAAFLLRHSGYDATTTRAIAAKVGIKAGSIYHYFPSKDAIVGEVVNEGVRVVHQAVTAALAALPVDAGPRQRLAAAIRGHLLSSLEHSDYTSASIRAFTFLPSTIRRGCRDERRLYEHIWRALVKELGDAKLLQPGVSLDSVRLLLLGAVNWAGEWYRPGHLTISKIAHDFTSCVAGNP